MALSTLERLISREHQKLFRLSASDNTNVLISDLAEQLNTALMAQADAFHGERNLTETTALLDYLEDFAEFSLRALASINKL
jgi:hypothetical protein